VRAAELVVEGGEGKVDIVGAKDFAEDGLLLVVEGAPDVMVEGLLPAEDGESCAFTICIDMRLGTTAKVSKHDRTIPDIGMRYFIVDYNIIWLYKIFVL
jgi:hypothetical protein